MILYLITNKTSGRRYVGITVRSLAHRFRIHVKAAKMGASQALARAIRKHGAAAFTIEQIGSAISWADLAALEQDAITEYRSHKDDGGYNLTRGGEGAHGRAQSAEARAKISAANKGRKASASTRALWSLQRKGRKPAPHTIALATAANRGRVKSPEERARISAAKKGRPLPAHVHAASRIRAMNRTAEERAAISARSKGRPRSAAVRAAISAKMRGRKFTPEHRAKLSASSRWHKRSTITQS